MAVAQDSVDQAVPEFSAVITCYFEEKTIDEFYGKLSSALKALGRSYEIILVNDGSTDGTYEKLMAIFAKNEDVRCVLDLFKNSGQLAAMTAGLCEARGRVILFIDSDLQLNPDDLPLLVREYDKGYDIVSGCRSERKDSFMRILPSKLANAIMRKVSDTKLTDFGCTFKLYNAKLLRSFELGPFKTFSTATAISRTRRVYEVPVRHYPRKHGKSGWTFKKLWQFNMDNIVNLSARPFQILAFWFSVLGALFVLRILASYIIPFKFLSAVTTGLLLNALVVSTLLILAVLCIIGEFTIRCFLMLQNVPRYVVRERHARD